MNPIKLAIVGASSTGKTTLISNLQKSFERNNAIAFVHESARQFFVDNPDQIAFTRTVQEQILERVLQNEKKATEHNPKIIITDTSIIETALYTQVNGDEEGASMLFEKIKPWIHTYKKFLLLNPNDVRFENDAIRKETKEVRDQIHHLMLISGTIPERIRRMHAIIQEYLQV